LSVQKFLFNAFIMLFKDFESLLMFFYFNLSLMNKLHLLLYDLIERLILVICILWKVFILVIIINLFVLRQRILVLWVVPVRHLNLFLSES